MGVVPFSFLVDSHWKEIIAKLRADITDLDSKRGSIYVGFAGTATSKEHARYAAARASRELKIPLTATPGAGGLTFRKK